jgi:hypothetical protein
MEQVPTDPASVEAIRIDIRSRWGLFQRPRGAGGEQDIDSLHLTGQNAQLQYWRFGF